MLPSNPAKLNKRVETPTFAYTRIIAVSCYCRFTGKHNNLQNSASRKQPIATPRLIPRSEKNGICMLFLFLCHVKLFISLQTVSSKRADDISSSGLFILGFARWSRHIFSFSLAVTRTLCILRVH